MKSPQDLARRWARQWENGDLRAARLLEDDFPAELSIGKPSARSVMDNAGLVKAHLEAWRGVAIGEIDWEPVTYRATGAAVEVPLRWRLRDAEEWARAASLVKEGAAMGREFVFLREVLPMAAEEFWDLLVRRRRLWAQVELGEMGKILEVAVLLGPRCAEGIPLRAFSVAGVDSKFFERNRVLLTRLLDCRFEGEVSRLGLAEFLGAEAKGGLWPLVVDLDGGILPAERMRLRVEDLEKVLILAQRCLIVENENCLHLIPKLPGTVAVLGAGMNLAWTAAECLREMPVAYWGDLDSWGLLMLGRVRERVPEVTAVCMTREIFEFHAEKAVVEPVIAGAEVPRGLSAVEGDFYRCLVGLERGRLEQEFLSRENLEMNLRGWMGKW